MTFKIIGVSSEKGTFGIALTSIDMWDKLHTEEYLEWSIKKAIRKAIRCPYCGEDHCHLNGPAPRKMTGESLPQTEHHKIPRMLCAKCGRTFTVYPPGFMPYIRELREFVKFAVEAFKLKEEKKQAPGPEHFGHLSSELFAFYLELSTAIQKQAKRFAAWLKRYDFLSSPTAPKIPQT